MLICLHKELQQKNYLNKQALCLQIKKLYVKWEKNSNYSKGLALYWKVKYIFPTVTDFKVML